MCLLSSNKMAIVQDQRSDISKSMIYSNFDTAISWLELQVSYLNLQESEICIFRAATVCSSGRSRGGKISSPVKAETNEDYNTKMKSFLIFTKLWELVNSGSTVITIPTWNKPAMNVDLRHFSFQLLIA